MSGLVFVWDIIGGEKILENEKKANCLKHLHSKSTEQTHPDAMKHFKSRNLKVFLTRQNLVKRKKEKVILRMKQLLYLN